MSENDKNKFKKFFSWFRFKKKTDKKNKSNQHISKKDIISKKKSLDLCSSSVSKNTVFDKQDKESLKLDKLNVKCFENKKSSINIKNQGKFSRLVQKLSKTKEQLGFRIHSLFFKQVIKDSFFEDIFEQLIISDIGLETTNELINSLKNAIYCQNLKDKKIVLLTLKKIMIDILKKVEKPLKITHKKPFFILVTGINGVGKTSIIGKLAHKFKSQGKSVMLAAGDTFRAAAVDQLKFFGEKSLIPVIFQKCGTDPASVIFNAFQVARSKNIDILIADTSGRLHNKSNLMEELKKIKRVIKKIDISAPDETILVLDACIGQNSINQAKIFKEALDVTGLVITKLDGTSKGGVIFSIAKNLSIPIRYISFGEKISDIDHFNSKNFVNAIFSENI
ncbi:MAG: signal recognition particle-docking protein FtsY [Buchnera aphidicola (Nurudea shiraii)]